MQLTANQLSSALQKGLVPVYFISGDEPQQLGEIADAIRQAARKAGYENREVMHVESNFNWNELALTADSLSIFSDKKLIDLRIPSGKPGSEGGKALISYCQRISVDTLLLITAGKLVASSKTSRWYQALDKAGVVIQVWPLQGRELMLWLQNRMHKRGMKCDTQSLKILAARSEGNLLAAAQEIEKLFILFGTGSIGNQALMDAVSDNSRYDVFKLVDSILAGQIGRVTKILQGLSAEGIAEPVVLWALTREARLLLSIKTQLKQGQSKTAVYKQNQIWEKRKAIIDSALQRLGSTQLQQILLLSAKADQQIKGMQLGDPWETLFSICLLFADAKLQPCAAQAYGLGLGSC